MEKPNNIPDYSQVERSRVPEDVTWNLDDIYPDIDAWEKEKSQLLELIDETNLSRMAENWTGSARNMLRFLRFTDTVGKLEDRTYGYPRLAADTDMENSTWLSMKGEIHTILVNLHSRLAFMDPDILKLGRKKINQYMEQEPGLTDYRQYFDSVLRMKKHILATDKESILARTGLFAGTPGKAAGMLNDVDIPAPRITLSDGQKIKLNPANYARYREARDRGDRIKVMRTFWKQHSKFRNTHAALLDGSMKTHFFTAGVRGFKSCLDAALFPNNISTKVYHTLVETVRGNLAPLHRYLRLKARMLKLDKLSYCDLYASSVPQVDKQYTFAQARDIIGDALAPMGESYTSVLRQGLDNRWTDIYPNKSKRSGAYSSGGLYDLHPYVLMNYNGTFNHVSTLAHEFGHALHSWFSNKNQPYSLAHYPIFLAEIASTFNETLLVEHMLKIENDDLVKLYILDGYLDEFRGTLFRQTQFAQFELDMHREVEQGRTLTPDWLDQHYLELVRDYYGHKKGVLKVPNYIANEWSYIPHFYYNFYVYQYSTGIAAATALAEMVLTGGTRERDRYMTLLKSGGSKYPLDILNEAGVDLTTPKPIEVAIQKFDRVIDEMEAIIQRLNIEQ